MCCVPQFRSHPFEHIVGLPEPICSGRSPLSDDDRGCQSQRHTLQGRSLPYAIPHRHANNTPVLNPMRSPCSSYSSSSASSCSVTAPKAVATMEASLSAASFESFTLAQKGSHSMSFALCATSSPFSLFGMLQTFSKMKQITIRQAYTGQNGRDTEVRILLLLTYRNVNSCIFESSTLL